MAIIFISYNRECKSSANDLIDDIKGLGHTVWFDQELSGGQAWWNKILETIRNCDLFVFALSSESLNSTACSLEYGYANDLGKTILPVLVGEEVSVNLLPSALSQIQFVDYRKRDRDAILRLAKAFAKAPPSLSLPDPLPLAPEVPLSYMGGFAKQIKKTAGLSYEEQSVLVVDLKRSLRDPEFANDARTLLKKLRNRRDLLANIAEEIDELLKNGGNETSVAPHEKPSSEVKKEKIFWTSRLGIIASITTIVTVMTSLYFVYEFITQKPQSPMSNILKIDPSAEVLSIPQGLNSRQEKTKKVQKSVAIKKKTDKAIAINPNTSDDAVYFFNKGYGFYSLKRYDEAIAAFDKAIAINPNYNDAFYNKGLALSNLKRYDKAIAAYEKVINIDPNDTDAINNKGLALYNLKRYDEAIVSFDKAIAINPNYNGAFFNKGLALSNLKRYDETIAAFDKAISIDPNDTDAINNKGLALYDLKQYDKAIIAFDKVSEIKPDYIKAFYNKGHVLYNVKLYDEAIMAFDEAIAINPNYSNAIYMKGLALSHLKRYDKAIAAYEKAIGINPNDTGSLNNKGLVLDTLKRYKEAIAAFDKAIAINPNYTDAFYNKGITLSNFKRYDEAIAAFDKAITIDPDYFNAFYRKAHVYVLKNNKEKFLSNLKKAIRNNKKYKEWAKTDEKFKRYWNDKDFQKLVN